LNRNQFKPTGFDFFGKKPVQTGLVFSVWLGFFRFSRVSRFFWFGSVWFFRFQACKTETEPVGFFKFLISFFHGSGFLIIFSV
jgi:hypothetical protein